MFSRLKAFLIGKPLDNEAIKDEKYGVLWGLPILASDAVSSVAYAGQEMLIVMLPIVGILAFGQLSVLSLGIIFLLALLTLSYRQTIDNYPCGGGAYIVAKENIGLIAGVTAGAALSVDYVLTVAVSVSSGVEQLTSAFPHLKKYTVIICVALVLLLMIGNLRGVRESSKIFGLPTYLFIIGIAIMIVAGFLKLTLGYTPKPVNVKSLGESVTLLLLLRAFSSGCTALTGIEAVSNAVPNFKDPSTKYAKRVLLLLSIIILVLFGGVSILANFYRVIPFENALLVLMAEEIFGRSFMYYYIAFTTFTILILAANTAYSGFPLLISIMAKERYAPRQLSFRGDRLSYDNGIVLLSIIASLLIIAFNAKVTSLIGLYAIGVFMSFTLSQFGMFLKWNREKGKHWHLKAFINGFGAFVTSIVVVIIAFAKFHEGAWIVVIIIPILIFLMLKVKKHYNSVQKQLKLRSEEYETCPVKKSYNNSVIVPIESINRTSMRALKYAKTISNDVTAFCVVIDHESEKEILEKYNRLGCDIPLKIIYSPFRKVLEPLLEYIKSEEFDHKKGDMITVILPQFVVKKWWHRVLHNNTRYFLERELLKHKHIVVSVMPLQLKDDDFVLNNPDYKF